MNRTWIHPLLAGVALNWIGLASYGASLPVSLDFLTGEWNTTEVHKEVAPGITCELVVHHVGGPDRLTFLSSRQSEDGPDSLTAFAHRIVASFTAYQISNQVEREATWMGFAGLDLRLELVSEKAALDCALFVFADQQTWWGAMYSKPKTTPATADAVFGLLRKARPDSDEVVGMEVLRIRDHPISDFPISIEVVRNAAGERVEKIVVKSFPVGGAAERAGVGIGDTIVAIDDRKTEDFAVGVGKDSELGRIFLNRQRGDKVKLTILRAGTKHPIPLTLYVRSRENPFDLLRDRNSTATRR